MTTEIVYAHLSGHPMNVGDTVLRRAYADVLRGDKRRLAVWTGTPDSGYSAGLGLRNCDREYKSFTTWYMAALCSSLRGNSSIALNAGAYSLTPRYLLINLILLPLCALTRIKRGSVIWLGAAVPQREFGRTWIFALVHRLTSLAKWRDTFTGTILPQSPTMPDWAFMISSPKTLDSRSTIAVSLRADQTPPTDNWIHSVKECAIRLGYNIEVVCQVREDDETGRALAERLGARFVGWHSDSHPIQEEIVRSVYRRSAIVASDRLHSLIIAATEGAIPTAWVEAPIQKVDHHLSHLGFSWVIAPDSDPIMAFNSFSENDAKVMLAETADIVKRLRDSLTAVSQEVDHLLCEAD